MSCVKPCDLFNVVLCAVSSKLSCYLPNYSCENMLLSIADILLCMFSGLGAPEGWHIFKCDRSPLTAQLLTMNLTPLA